MQEEWKIIEGYPNYKISNFGNIYNIKTNKEVTKTKHGNRFECCVRDKENNKKLISVAKLVALAFVENKNGGDKVYHIDKNSLNNRCDNLIWKITKNRYKIFNNIVVGYDLNNNKFIFDIDDYERVRNFQWYMKDNGYISCTGSRKNKNKTLHRFIMNCNNNEIIDHINRNKLDNRKSNLRIVNISENNHNRGIGKNNTSGIIGINIYYKSKKKGNKYRAYIEIENKRIYLLSSYNKEECIKARLQAELKYFGEFAPQRHLFEKYGIK